MNKMVDHVIYMLFVAIVIYFALCIKDYISKYLGRKPGRNHG